MAKYGFAIMLMGIIVALGACLTIDWAWIVGLVLGVIQALTVWQFSSNWQNAVTFVLLLILLFIRPQGIAGYKQRTI